MALVVDTGVPYAALDRSDRPHAACRALLDGCTERIVRPGLALPTWTTGWRNTSGAGGTVALLRDVRRGALEIEDPRTPS